MFALTYEISSLATNVKAGRDWLSASVAVGATQKSRPEYTTLLKFIAPVPLTQPPTKKSSAVLTNVEPPPQMILMVPVPVPVVIL